MSVDTTKDPIFQIFQGIWDCLEASTAFTDLVLAGNRIDYTSDKRTADKPGLTTADTPQVRVVQLSLRGNIPRTSNSCSLEVFWGIEVKVGDKRLEMLTELQWAIYAAMSNWFTYLRDAVTWLGENVVTRCLPMQADTDYAVKSGDQAPAGWVSVWRGSTELFVLTGDAQTWDGGT